MPGVSGRVGRLLPGFMQKPLKNLRARVRFALDPLDLMRNAPDLFKAYRSLSSRPNVERQPGGWVYQGTFYPDYLTEGGASGAIFREARKFCRGEGIDVGAGHWPLPGATAVDLQRGVGAGRSWSEFADESLDYVFSSHCLEHIEDWHGAMDEWTEKVRPGGHLFLVPLSSEQATSGRQPPRSSRMR